MGNSTAAVVGRSLCLKAVSVDETRRIGVKSFTVADVVVGIN